MLAIGNVCFEDHGDGKRATVIETPDDALERAAACLGVDATALEAALTAVTLVVGGGDIAGGVESSNNRVIRRDPSSWIGVGNLVRGREYKFNKLTQVE